MTTRKSTKNVVVESINEEAIEMNTLDKDEAIITNTMVPVIGEFNIQQLINDKVNKSIILSLIQFNMKLTKQQSIDELKKYEMSSNKNDVSSIVKVIIENKSMKRKELSKLISSMNLCSESTAFHYLSMMNVIEEYHNQMKVIEANQ